jgi:hypothetical protein
MIPELFLTLYVLCAFVYGVLELRELSDQHGPKAWFIPWFLVIFFFLPVLVVVRKYRESRKS